MKELTRHIEALLLENDCVILPHFGGFVTNHASAKWVEDEQTYLPPYRTVGFNPQLKINDGLLVQSYMQTHDATYPEATRLVELAVDELTEYLYKDGIVELHGIGVLHRTIEGEYHFEPTEDGVITPALYGFSSLNITPLAQLSAAKSADEENEGNKTINVIENKNNTLTIKIRHKWIANVSAAAAAVALFFCLSTPVGNTHIEEENYASLGSVSVFEQVSKESLITNIVTMPAAKAKEAKSAAPAKAKATVKGQTASAAESTAQPEAKHVQPKTIDIQPEPAVAGEATTEQPAAIPTASTAEAKSATKAAPTLSAVKTETPKQETKPTMPLAAPTPKKASPSYNIIIASVTSENEADQAIKTFAEKGHPGAFLIKGQGRFRIALKAFDNEADAYRNANELKANELFKDAWVLKTRK